MSEFGGLWKQEETQHALKKWHNSQLVDCGHYTEEEVHTHTHTLAHTHTTHTCTCVYNDPMECFQALQNLSR